jgi:hypothetical protein
MHSVHHVGVTGAARRAAQRRAVTHRRRCAVTRARHQPMWVAPAVALAATTAPRRILRPYLGPSGHPSQSQSPFRLCAHKRNIGDGFHAEPIVICTGREVHCESKEDHGRSRYRRRLSHHSSRTGRRGCGECCPYLPSHVRDTVAARRPRMGPLRRPRLGMRRLGRPRVGPRVVRPWAQRVHQRHRSVGICHR